jgi:hypothetical protein
MRFMKEKQCAYPNALGDSMALMAMDEKLCGFRSSAPRGSNLV